MVGLGTWITFNVGGDPVLRDERAGVMAAFFEAGGRMIDSSPMYGSSQPVIGYGFTTLPRRYEWSELLFGIPLILFTFGFVIWRRGFTAEDRALFRKHKGEEPTLPAPGTSEA